MRLRVRVGALILSIVIASTMIAGCGKKAEAPVKSEATAQDDTPSYMNKTGYPIVKEPITLKFMVRRMDTQPDYNQILALQEYEKLSGIKINWDQCPQASYTEKRNLAFASGDYPDVFYRMYMVDKDIVNYGSQGVLVDIKDLIEKYGTNLKEVFKKFPDVKKGLIQYNDAIYTLPAIYDTPDALTGRKLFVNTKWLQKVNMQMPKTTDDLYKLLKAFKDSDANGNGKADEIPFTSETLTGIIEVLRGAWGLGNRGYLQDYIDVDEKTDKVRFYKIDPKFKEMLQYINTLYKEGLLDKEIFTMNSTQLAAKGNANQVGVVANVTSSCVGTTYENDLAGIDVALKGPEGDQLWSPYRPHLQQKGAFTMTKADKYPEATMRWIDYWYGDEGVKSMYLGVEGKSYEKKADGSYRYLDSIVNPPAGTTFDAVIAKYAPYSGGGSPTIVIDKYFNGRGEIGLSNKKAAQNMQPFIPKDAWPTLNYTLEENDKLTTLETDLKSYVSSAISEFMSGKRPLTEWDNYVAQVKKLKVDEYLSIVQAGYDRYKK